MTQTQTKVETSTDDLIAQLTGRAAAVMTRFQDETIDPIAKIKEIEAGIEETSKIRDETARKMRMDILTADFEELHKSIETEEKDLSQVVFGLRGLMVAMGKEYENLQTPSATEQQLITNAEQRLVAAQRDLILAEASRWNLFGSKDRAIAAAKLAIQSAEERKVKAAEEVSLMVRERLLHADIESSLQTFMKTANDIIDIMQKRKVTVNEQLTIVGNQKVRAFQIKEQAAQALEILNDELAKAETSLQSEEEVLSSLMNGSAEYAMQTTKISTLRAEVEEVRGRRNNALGLYQSKESFSTQLEIEERTLRKYRDNQQLMITILKSDTEERVVTFKARLETMKAMSDQDIAVNIAGIGAKIDQATAEFMAKAGSASDRTTVALLESQPERMRKLAEVKAAQAEATADIRDRFADIIKEVRESYGIDPLDSSFFTFSSTDGGTAGAPVGRSAGSPNPA